MCLEFAVVVLTLTAVWVYVLPERSFTFLAYAMYFPGMTALCWSAGTGNLTTFLTRLPGSGQVNI